MENGNSLNTKAQIVKKYIDEMDYYALLAGGAPSDEFDRESREIAERIDLNCSTEEIAAIIADIMNKAFDENDSADVFADIAGKIRLALQSTMI